jgi:hypothetical protein
MAAAFINRPKSTAQINSGLKIKMPQMKKGFLAWLLICLFISCQTNHSTPNSKETELVIDGVSLLTSNIAKDLSVYGPIAWLNYFEEEPGFFMASDGKLAFKDYQSANIFIEYTLVKTIPKVKLHWNNLRIDPLTSSLAAVGADFHEDLTDSAGKTFPVDGYFTAIAEETSHGWLLRNLHWSVLKIN